MHKNVSDFLDKYQENKELCKKEMQESKQKAQDIFNGINFGSIAFKVKPQKHARDL